MSDPSLEQQLRLVGEFAACFGGAAQGFAREELSPEEVKKLNSLAAGELGGEQKDELVTLLQSNEAAMELLAKLATA